MSSYCELVQGKIVLLAAAAYFGSMVQYLTVMYTMASSIGRWHGPAMVFGQA
jgi:hypothetical protein